MAAGPPLSLQKPFINMSPDLTASNILFDLNNIDTWSEVEVYQRLGPPQTDKVCSRSGATVVPHAPHYLVDSIQYSHTIAEYLTGSIRITDFGEAFFLKKPPTPFPGTPACYFAPEMLFGHPASAQSDIWALGCLVFQLRAWRPLFCTFFGVHAEVFLEIVNTLGPFPKAWQNTFCGDYDHTMFVPGHWGPWFDSGTLRHSLESLVSQMKRKPTAEETSAFLDILKGAVQYEPSCRCSAQQLANHKWLQADFD